MQNIGYQNLETCERERVIAYLDSELSAPDELGFELHLTNCSACVAELNEQKRLLSVLESAFDENFGFSETPEIELPKDFAKKIATRAESDFQGLRRPTEWLRALLLTFGLFGLGLAVGIFLKKTEILGLLIDQTTKIFIAIGGFLVNLTYDVSLSFAVIFRTLSRHFLLGSSLSALFLIASLTFSFLLLSRLLFRYPKN